MHAYLTQLGCSKPWFEAIFFAVLIMNMFILKYISLRNHFWFLVGDRDVSTVAPNLIVMMIILMIVMMIIMMIMKVVMVVTMMLTMMTPRSWS